MAVTLGEALLSAIAKGMIGMGDGDVGASSDAGKDAGTCQAPASQNREKTTQPAHGTAASLANGKRLDTAVTSRSPSGAVSRRLALRVIEGGRPTGGGGSRAAYRAATGRERVREWSVIEGGRRHWTASAF